MMKQYRAMKEQHKDAVLFFRLGDFYEMFERDAVEVSAILNLTLTKRHDYQMCGIPYHAAQNYILRLLKAGKKIAICEQVTRPGEQKGIVERKVVQVITPGTIIEENFLDSSSSNYLASFSRYKNFLSFSYIEISTGDFYVSKFRFSDNNHLCSIIKKEIARLNPTEILIQESMLEYTDGVSEIFDYYDQIMVNRFPDWSYDIEMSETKLLAFLKTSSLSGFGIPEKDPSIHSAKVLIDYVEDNLGLKISYIKNIFLYTDTDYLILDESTRNNLEIVKNLRDASSKYTLFSVLDYTKTAAGRRLLKLRLQNPLLSLQAINNRLDNVELLYHKQKVLSNLRQALSRSLDLQRLISKIGTERVNPKELLALKQTLASVAEINDILAGDSVNLSIQLPQQQAILDLYNFLDQTINDDASTLLQEGNIVKPGYNAELDRLRSLKKDSKKILDNYLESEKEKTGISTLKLKYNKIIGYFIEVRKSNSNNLPDYFIRRQSLVNGERFTTEKLGDIEIELNNATETANNLEREIFHRIKAHILTQLDFIYDIANFLAEIDFLQSSAYCATVRAYTRPNVCEKEGIKIVEGRHPVVEAELKTDSFIPNDTTMTIDNLFFTILTGPNMAGKSTYLRQSALIVLMAQAGLFVPAKFAKIGIVDRIFCRVGASDNLAKGESTFLVEMNETANILRNATSSSLVIMDEVGRGTSTSDGLSIARAVCEFLIRKKIKTLFATHYHELTRIKDKSVVNKSLEVADDNGKIVFLKKVIDGASGSSYGIHVASLAGLPEEVILRAQEILRTDSPQKDNNSETEYLVPKAINPGELFSPSTLLLQEMVSFDVMNNSPFELMQKFHVWQEKIKKIL
ncbi:MAG: DNA mismatch repair protein MutS [Spirochaetales bacterium]|nr:DNA mismatch repair protein MutS [Spirochaetales bacterium]